MAFFRQVKVFATRGSDGLAREVCYYLQTRLPKKLQPDGHLTLGRVNIQEFSNDNILLQVENVREHFVVIIHTQTPPVDKRLIELFHLIDAVNNAQASDVLLVFPYMPYARSDRKNQPRISTFGKTLPDILTNSFGIRRVILLDPHDSHLKHYFKPAADEISAIYLLMDYLERNIFKSKSKENSVMVFSDAGAAKRYGPIAEFLGMPEAHISKQRRDNTEKVQAKKVVGEVKNKFCLLVDDEILTGGTAVTDAKILLEDGAASVFMLAIHAILADKNSQDSEVIKKLEMSPIERFVVTDSIPLQHKLDQSSKITVVSVTRLLAEAISRAVLGKSLTALHRYENVHWYRQDTLCDI